MNAGRSLLRAALAWRSRPALVDGALASLPPGGAGRPVPGRVAAVQLRIRSYRSAAEFAAHVGAWAARAAAAGASLAVFPEDTATGLLGMIPGFDRLARGALAAGEAGGAGGLRPADVFAFAAPYVEPVYRRTFASLARRYRLALVAGTALLPRAGGLRNLCHVFDPGGRLVGVQPKLHLFPHEAAWGLQTGDDLAVWPSPAGALAVAVCMDATYFETFRVARALGAELVAVPAANPEDYNPWTALRGPWPRAQESQVYAVHSCLIGELLGFRLSGRSAVYAPLELTAAGDGVLAAVDDFEAEGLAVADLDLPALARLRRDRPAAVPRAFCRRWLPAVYGEPAGAGRLEGGDGL